MKLDIFKIKIAMARSEKDVNDLAAIMGCSVQNIRRIMANESCTTKTLGKLARALNCDPLDLVTLDE